MKAFLFSYGGNNDRGEVIHLGDTYNVNFPKENEACYGVAFRRDVDIEFEDNAQELTIEFESKLPFKATLEFKTEKSGGAPEESFVLNAKEGFNSHTFPMPELNSRLKEICFCIFKNENLNLETEISILSFNVK